MTKVKGYIPHECQTQILCTKCGCEYFDCPPQSIPVDDNCDMWTYEYVCIKCGQRIGITVKR